MTADLPVSAIEQANPARLEGQVESIQGSPAPLDRRIAEVDLPGGACLINLTQATDLRGSLVALEFEAQLPFSPRRFFTVFDVPSSHVRGEHAHRTCHQLLIALSGALTVMLDDGSRRAEVRLDRPAVGLYIPPMVWGAQFHHAPGTMLGVFASERYDPAEYVWTHEAFLEMRGQQGLES